MTQLIQLQKTIIGCRRCPRLVSWRERVAQERVARFIDWEYWGKPVPGFGDPKAQMLIVGLAPAAHGANRTGRMFTGDRSGDWLYRALHKAGIATKPGSESRRDGQQLVNCYITAAVRCAPPENKPDITEFTNCRPFLIEEMKLLRNVRVIVALGGIAWHAVHLAAEEMGLAPGKKRMKFSHCASTRFGERFAMVGSYHPSQQNTFTGKLTEEMFDRVFRAAQKLLLE